MKVDNNLLKVVCQKVLHNDTEYTKEEPIKQDRPNLAIQEESIDGDTLEISNDAFNMQNYIITGEIIDSVASKIAKSIIG